MPPVYNQRAAALHFGVHALLPDYGNPIVTEFDVGGVEESRVGGGQGGFGDKRMKTEYASTPTLSAASSSPSTGEGSARGLNQARGDELREGGVKVVARLVA